jgi:sulfur carrier protein
VPRLALRRLRHRREMRLTINGESREIESCATLAALLDHFGIALDGVAVAVNDAVVPRGSFGMHPLADGDRVEIIKAVAGG